MSYKQRKMPSVILASSAIALILATASCGDKPGSHTPPAAPAKFNTAPVANAGTDMIARVGEVVTLNGTQSSDPDHDLMTFSWKQTSGPAVELTGADTLSPTFVAPASKSPLEFALVVNDGKINSADDKVSVAISNRAPTANAGRTIIAKRGSTITLDGGASMDPDNDAVTYKWEQVYGPVVTVTGGDSGSPTFTMPNVSGYVIFALTVNDGTDESVADTVAIKMTNTPPIANVADITENVFAGKEVSLDGSTSSDAEGDTLAYSWRQTLGTPVMLKNSDSATPSFVAPDRPDHLIFEVMVNDGEFSSHVDSVVVSVKHEVKAPENVADKTKIAQAKQVQVTLEPKKTELPVLAVAEAPAPVENFLTEMAAKVEAPAVPAQAKPEAKADAKHETGHKPHWSYEGEGGPQHWGSLDPAFSLCDTGKQQSPIDIQTTGLKQDPKPIEFNYATSSLKVVNNGHTIQVNYEAGSHAIIDGKRFDLLQFHFHSPSEETIDGKPADMVAHLVHKAEDSQLAVVAVHFRQGQENQFLKPIWSNLPSEAGMETSSSETIFASAMLPENKAYYHFEGSLTTPPCSENVSWNVLAEMQEISSAQIEAFTTLFPMSARPVQPLFGRVVTLH